MIKFINIAFYFVFGFTAFNWLGWPIELRFAESYLNYYFITLLCFLLPISLFFKLLITSTKRNFIVAFVLVVLLGCGCFVVGGFAYLDARDIVKSKVDYSFEKLEEIKHKSTYYRLYRTNGGATTSFGLVLRAESEEFIGIKMVKVLYSKYQASEAKMNIVDDNIELQTQPYSKDDAVEFVSIKW